MNNINKMTKLFVFLFPFLFLSSPFHSAEAELFSIQLHTDHEEDAEELWNALIGKPSLHSSVLKGDFNEVKSLIVKDFSELVSLRSPSFIIAKFLVTKELYVNAVDEKGYTALHLAAEEGRFQIADLLIQNGAYVDIENFSGYTPLDLANRNGHADIVEIIKKYGVKK